MLALARKVNESIIINDNVEVTILEIKGAQIKIESVSVYRKEIYSQIQDSNREAAGAAGPDALTQLLN